MRLQANTELVTGRYTSYDSLVGIAPEAFELLNIPLIEGSGFASDGSTKNIEITLGRQNKSYFQRKNSYVWGEEPDLDWLNEKFTLNFITYDTSGEEAVETRKSYKATVVGITGNLDERYGSMHDNYNYADIDVLKRLAKENPRAMYQEVSGTYEECWVKVDDYTNVEAVMDAMKEGNTLSIYSDMEYINSMRNQANSMQLLLGGIGSITMLVAAISIANTMLMSIYERTREIGVMKVLGCRLGNISMLFLGEAGFIGLFGGVVGVGLSYGLSAVLNFIFAYYGQGGMGAMQSYIPAWLALLALVFSVGVGMLSGLYPSQRAMRLSALAAIRNDI
jgi:ABC-type antimicrobial peptide transport system permease subunit